MPMVLALPLQTAMARLAEEGFACEVEFVLPPKMREEDFQGRDIRRYVVRQRRLDENKVLLSVVFREHSLTDAPGGFAL